MFDHDFVLIYLILFFCYQNFSIFQLLIHIQFILSYCQSFNLKQSKSSKQNSIYSKFIILRRKKFLGKCFFYRTTKSFLLPTFKDIHSFFNSKKTEPHFQQINTKGKKINYLIENDIMII